MFDDEMTAVIVREAWLNIPRHPTALGVLLDEWVLMPNHLHGVLLLPGKGAEAATVEPALPVSPVNMGKLDTSPRAFGRGPAPRSLGAIIGGFKSSVTRRINAAAPGRYGRLWQRGYYEHIVRDARELERIRVYIRENPIRWAEDRDDLQHLMDRMTAGGRTD